MHLPDIDSTDLEDCPFCGGCSSNLCADKILSVATLSSSLRQKLRERLQRKQAASTSYFGEAVSTSYFGEAVSTSYFGEAVAISVL